ncbi:hypothetical protein BaRGS_00025496 [Batillaria attramentaria]|uniref:Uncharacterized protein n=1 Tax=Batillaria attramentaria TaxID=370345 RepID=A0ABD0K8C8_9CAEN
MHFHSIPSRQSQLGKYCDFFLQKVKSSERKAHAPNSRRETLSKMPTLLFGRTKTATVCAVHRNTSTQTLIHFSLWHCWLMSVQLFQTRGASSCSTLPDTWCQVHVQLFQTRGASSCSTLPDTWCQFMFNSSRHVVPVHVQLFQTRGASSCSTLPDTWCQFMFNSSGRHVVPVHVQLFQTRGASSCSTLPDTWCQFNQSLISSH